MCTVQTFLGSKSLQLHTCSDSCIQFQWPDEIACFKIRTDDFHPMSLQILPRVEAFQTSAFHSSRWFVPGSLSGRNTKQRALKNKLKQDENKQICLFQKCCQTKAFAIEIDCGGCWLINGVLVLLDAGQFHNLQVGSRNRLLGAGCIDKQQHHRATRSVAIRGKKAIRATSNADREQF